MTAKLVPSIRLAALGGLCLLLALAATPATGHAEEIQITIEVSPRTLNLGSDAEVVTVHTDIAYSVVVGSTVTLFFGDADVPISWWKSDDRGYFVAKFPMAAIRDLDEELQIPGRNIFGLDGYTEGGDHFVGVDDEVIVVDGGGRQGGKGN